ncbi:Aste57867_19569 [Aphanomyces stellatus]|uniref:Aste57867_19569 protein n=1 Tax=Aphanomyces stellatus TaxID=120398 RepID=A0A485LCT0_9STRA|nr:hypothetical protein As57867_019505 [Aphanomyces stellatus]VFT96273.1 Aste57867_19569 [Aphanomyces stellatus]
MKKLAFEIAALLQVPNVHQDPVLVGRVREIQQQIEKLQTAQREFRHEIAFQLHLYKAERSSKFHFMSPVPSPLRKTIFKEMENSAGNLVTTQNGISDVLVDYYSDLFAPPSTRPEDDDLTVFLGPLTKDKQSPIGRKWNWQLHYVPTSSTTRFEKAARIQHQAPMRCRLKSSSWHRTSGLWFWSWYSRTSFTGTLA